MKTIQSMERLLMRRERTKAVVAETTPTTFMMCGMYSRRIRQKNTLSAYVAASLIRSWQFSTTVEEARLPVMMMIATASRNLF